MRVLYAAIALTLMALPASAQKPATQPKVQQKAAPTAAAPKVKGDRNTLMLYELRIQQYADRMVAAADKGESIAIVDYLLRNMSSSLKGGEAHLKALQATANPEQAKDLAVVAQHHYAAQKAFDALRTELNVKDRDPSRATAMRLSYQISDEAALAQGKKPVKHPVIKTDAPAPAKPKS